MPHSSSPSSRRTSRAARVNRPATRVRRPRQRKPSLVKRALSTLLAASALVASTWMAVPRPPAAAAAAPATVPVPISIPVLSRVPVGQPASRIMYDLQLRTRVHIDIYPEECAVESELFISPEILVRQRLRVYGARRD